VNRRRLALTQSSLRSIDLFAATSSTPKMLSVKSFIVSLSILIAVLCVSRVLYVTYRAARSPLRSVPGPFIAKFTSMWLFIRYAKNNFHHENYELHRNMVLCSNDHSRHLVPQCPNIALTGPIVRLAPERYSIDDPEGAKIIYNTTNVFRKSRWYWANGHPDPDKSNIFAEGNNKEALRMRRNFAPAFQMGAILTYEPHIDECSRIL
jgi:hypothetical protein